MAYFDPTTRFYKPAVYTWDDLVLETWDSAVTWEDYTGSYTSSVGIPDLTYTTDIIDFGRVDWVNPLCSVQSSGTHVIKVYAAESIDSSSLLPGDPVIDTSDSTVRIPAIYGRYFQFKIEVFDGVNSYVRSVQTDLTSETRAEIIIDNSANHVGTDNARIAPLTKEYSKVLALIGSAQKEVGKIGIINHGDLSDPTAPRYTVLNGYTAGVTPDSSTVPAIVDIANNATITTFNTVTANSSQYQWPIASVEFNENDGSSTITDTNSYLQFNMSGITTGDFTIDWWLKLYASPDGSQPNLQHPAYFMDIGGLNLQLRTVTDSGIVRLDYNLNGAGWVTGTPRISNRFMHMAVQRSGGNIYLYHWGYYNATITTGDSTNMSGVTVSVGDLGGPATANFYIDDLRVSDTTRFPDAANYTRPSAEHIVDANTTFLLTAESAIELPSVIDANVVLHIIGLPKMIVNSTGNIVEE